MSTKIVALHVARSFGLFGLARWLTRDWARILCYHSVYLSTVPYAGDAMFMQGRTFRARLALLKRRGYSVRPLSEVVENAGRRAGRVDSPIAITIDDGWFGTYRDMLPALLEERLPATLYCDTRHLLQGGTVVHVLASTVKRIWGNSPLPPDARVALAGATDPSASGEERLEHARLLCQRLGLDLNELVDSRTFSYMTPDEFRHFADSPGIQIELHTHRHTMADHSPEAVRREIEDNRAALAQILDRDPRSFRHFCYPSGDARNSDEAVLDSLGISSATTTRQGLAPANPAKRFQLPRLLDGENVSEIEFEAEVSGFMHLARRLLGRSA